MFRWLRRLAPGPLTAQALITQEQARSIIEAEVARRNWSEFDVRTYSLFQSKDGLRWLCQGFMSRALGGVMNIEIDGQTGELVSASAGGR